MREELQDFEVVEVAGGRVNLSKNKNRIGFTTLGEGYDLKCSFNEAYALASSLFLEHTDMSAEEFDQYVKNAFIAKGWI